MQNDFAHSQSVNWVWEMQMFKTSKKWIIIHKISTTPWTEKIYIEDKVKYLSKILTSFL